ncbi:MAG: DUF4876 domain-containing protein [Bacteroidales bacterium]|nr:DUF4876 domain-containing protein [Bacteroidales bacterium]
MKHLKFYAGIITVLMLLSQITFISCTEDYGPDIEKLKEDVSEIQEQLTKLEEAYSSGKIITKVDPLQGAEPNSWQITFSDNSSISIYSGKDGVNGADGKDGITPYLKVNNEGYWIVSYNNAQTFDILADASGSPVYAKGIDGINGTDGKDGADGQDGINGTDGKDGVDGQDGVSVEVRVNQDGYYEIITYLEDKNNPISVQTTPYSSNPSNQIASIVENSLTGEITLTMASGKEYKFGSKVVYPTSIIVLTKEVEIETEGATAEIEFRVNPSNAVITKADIAIDKISPKAYAESYVTVSENYEIEGLRASVNGKGETLRGQYILTIKDKGAGEYSENCTLVITTKDAQDNTIQISSDEFLIYASYLSMPPLVIKEFYTAMCKHSETHKNYMYDQFYEIYNNSAKVQYLDNCILAKTEVQANSKIIYWPDNDEENKEVAVSSYVAGFVGDGTGKKYPLEPGQSVVIAFQAQNHTIMSDNPDTEEVEVNTNTIDLSKADYEIDITEYRPTYVANPDVPNLTILAKPGTQTLLFGLIPAFGAGLVLAQVDDVEAYVADQANWKTKPEGTDQEPYLMIKYKDIQDAINIVCETETNRRVVLPATVDAGMLWTSAMYNGMGFTRKVHKVINGRIIYKDTNNSSEDFEPEAKPSPGM